MTERLVLSPAREPLDAVATVPGSKSIANRALVCAALADGISELSPIAPGDDTVAMVRSLAALGVSIEVVGDRAVVSGTAGRLAAGATTLDAGLAGTTSRFVTAVAALAPGPITIDGAAPLRARPMGPLHDALRALGVTVDGPGGRLPVTVSGPLRRGGSLRLRGDVSSQYLTALMMVAPLLDGGLRIELTTPLVSVPYVELTAAVMAAFGVGGVTVDGANVIVPPGRYRGTPFAVEPDASSASYPLAMAAVAGGRVRVPGLRLTSRQGDVAVATLLGSMGCTVRDAASGLTVARTVGLRGIEIDMADISDLVPTIAVVAATASTPTVIGGVGFIRAKESDRLGDLAGELAKTGARIEVLADGLRIDPPIAPLHGAVLATHDDHRLAMAFGVLATAVAGIEILDPGVVSKSWPDFWHVRERIIAAA